MSRTATVLAAVAAVATACQLAGIRLDAHRTAASPYTFYRDVLPIVEARCVRCHSDTSVSGLSLANFESARQSSWPMRQRLMRGHMPPWFADGPFRSPDAVTARELNVLLTWAAGGAPEGKPLERTVSHPTTWAAGTPDQIVTMPSPFTPTLLGEQVHEVVLPGARIGGRSIRAVDLKPGAPSIVRRAEIVARRGQVEQVLGLWQPGERPAVLPLNAGFAIPRQAELLLRVHYKRAFGSAAVSDRSEVGIYFADPKASAIRTVEIETEAWRAMSRTITSPTRVVAIRPLTGPAGTQISIAIIRADGSTHALARLEIQPAWKRRYVLVDAVPLQVGDRIVTSVLESQAVLWSQLTAERSDPKSTAKLIFEVID